MSCIAPSSLDTGEASAPLWAKAVAAIVALTPLPSSAYRMAFLLDSKDSLPSTYAQDFGQFAAYVTMLSLITCFAAFLAFGLVSRWGRVPPAWIPILGGREMRPWPVFATALAGAVAVSLVTAHVLGGVLSRFRGGPPDLIKQVNADYSLVLACYLPLALWGPLLFILAMNYRSRMIAPPRH